MSMHILHTKHLQRHWHERPWNICASHKISQPPSLTLDPQPAEQARRPPSTSVLTAAVRRWRCFVQMQLCSRVVRQNELSLATLSNESCSVSRFPAALSWMSTFNMLTEVWWERCWVFGAVHWCWGEFAGASALTGSCFHSLTNVLSQCSHSDGQQQLLL